jgi:hypothetical protein
MDLCREQAERLERLANYKAEVYLLEADAEALRQLLREWKELRAVFYVTLALIAVMALVSLL